MSILVNEGFMLSLFLKASVEWKLLQIRIMHYYLAMIANLCNLWIVNI
jgi:hypothetical protein